MDDRSPPSQPRRGLLSGGYADEARRDEPPRGQPQSQGRRGLLSGGYAAGDEPSRGQPDTQPRRGLLSGGYGESGKGDYSDDDAGEDEEPARQPASASRGAGRPGGLLSRFAPPPGERQSGWSQLTGAARRLGQTIFGRAVNAPEQPQPAAGERAPGHRDWRATDFSTGDLDHWDKRGEAPFEQPPDPDAPPPRADERDDPDDLDDYDGGDFRDQYSDIRGAAPRRASAYDDESREYPARDDRRGAPTDKDTGEYGTGDYGTGSYDTGGYDTGAYDDRDPPRGRRGAYAERERAWDEDSREERAYTPPPRDYRRELSRPQRNVVGSLRSALDYTAMSEALNTLAQLGSTARPISRIDRLRLLGKRRPAAAGLLGLFLLGFALTCLIPLVTLMRLAGDQRDLAQRMADLEQLAAGGLPQLIFSGKLSAAQDDILAIQSDLYTLNGVMTVTGAPLGLVSHSVRAELGLAHIGYDLATAANDGMLIAQTVLAPVENGILAPTANSAPVTAAGIQQARAWLDDADAHVYDAQQTYQSLDPGALPADYQPGGRYGALLAGLPALHTLLGQLRPLLAEAPTLLGVSQPAYYLVIGMNSAQLRPGGGIQSSYGLLRIAGGQQSLSSPFSLADTYQLDSLYAQKAGAKTADCAAAVTEPPASAWWWPRRCVAKYGFGLRDENLAPDFPTNAQSAMSIVQATGTLPAGATLQGVIAYTPGMLARALDATGPLPLPEYNITVTGSNLQQELRALQSTTPVGAGQDHERFSHTLLADLMERLGALQGPRLSAFFAALGESATAKDLQLYLSDPLAEAALVRMKLASSMSTSGDGFFVVDTNTGGNEANRYVTETQTDLVTLLPNGDALHQLAIAITYDKQGDVTLPGASFQEYSDLQRVYLPGAAAVAGWSGYTPAALAPTACASAGRLYAALVTDCSTAHGIYGAVTGSDTPGRVMALGPVLVICGATAQGDWGAFSPAADAAACAAHPKPHTQTIFITWTTPHAYSPNGDHGSWSELVEKQPGAASTLMVYVTRGSASAPQVVTSLETFTSLIASAHRAFSGPLTRDEVVSWSY